jgi:hypothetical protein
MTYSFIPMLFLQCPSYEIDQTGAEFCIIFVLSTTLVYSFVNSRLCGVQVVGTMCHSFYKFHCIEVSKQVNYFNK